MTDSFHTISKQFAEALRDGADASAIADILDPLPFEEWQSLVEHVLREQPQEAEKLLRWTARWHSEDDRRFRAISILRENGLLDDEFHSDLLQHERDPANRELLEARRG